MEVQWQPPFIFRALAVNKYDRAQLSWQSSDKELYSYRLAVVSRSYGLFTSEKELVLRLRPERERSTDMGRGRAVMWRTHPSTSHLLFYNSLWKEKKQPWSYF